MHLIKYPFAHTVYIYLFLAGNNDNIFMPPGCSCSESGVGASQCTKFDCGCTCDITAGACDLNCCCDSECTAAQVAHFEDTASCIPSSLAAPAYETCYSNVQLAEINPKYPMRSDESASAAYSALMCVQTDNSGTKGTFFSSGTTHASLYPSAGETFGTTGGVADCATTFDYECYLGAPQSVGNHEGYVQGDTIAVRSGSIDDTDPAAPVTTSVFPAYGGTLTLPTRGATGSCVDTSSVEFGTDYSSSCVRAVSDIDLTNTQQCAALSPTRYTDLFVGTMQKLKGEFKEASLAGYTAVQSSDAVAPGASAVVDNGGGTFNCINAAASVEYVVSYSDAFLITGVAVSVTTVNLAVGAGAPVFSQQFSVVFRPVQHTNEINGVARTVISNNVVSRLRSGNPGYIVGRPVLAALEHPIDVNVEGNPTGQSEKAVSAYVDGFPVMSSVDGMCDGAGVEMHTQTVTFGEDMSTSCTLALTKAQLETLCDSSTTRETAGFGYLRDVGTDKVVPKWLLTPTKNDTSGAIDDLYFGIFGNADPLDITQWLMVENNGIDNNGIDETREFVSAQAKCQGFVTHTRYKIAYTYVGNVKNPQAKIISALVDYDSVDMTFDDMRLGDSAVQNFEFGVTVSWIYVQQDQEIYSPPPPPIIFSVPYDVFYPFQIDSPAARGSGASGAVVFIGVVMAVATGLGLLL